MFELIVGKPALLVIDLQRDFVKPRTPGHADVVHEIIPRIAKVIDAAKSAGVPVIYTQEAHRPGRVDSGREADEGTGVSYGHPIDAPTSEHTVEGTPGIEIIDELTPDPADLRITKRRYSCFLGTDLDLLLRGLGVQTLLITGVDANVCVLYTVADGFQLDYFVRVLEDCVAGTTPEEHEAALLIMRNLTTGRRITSEDVLGALDGMRARAERGGFEPPRASRPNRFSKPAP